MQKIIWQGTLTQYLSQTTDLGYMFETRGLKLQLVIVH